MAKEGRAGCRAARGEEERPGCVLRWKNKRKGAQKKSRTQETNRQTANGAAAHGGWGWVRVMKVKKTRKSRCEKVHRAGTPRTKDGFSNKAGLRWGKKQKKGRKKSTVKPQTSWSVGPGKTTPKTASGRKVTESRSPSSTRRHEGTAAGAQ